MKIVSYDTGGITGCAWWQAGGRTGHINSAGLERAAAEDHMRIFVPWADLVVIEQLTITANSHKKTRDLIPAIELVGVAKYFARVFETTWMEQMPVEVMKFASNDKLKRIGWHVPGPDHENDARRHILTVIVERGLIDPRSIMRPEGGT